MKQREEREDLDIVEQTNMIIYVTITAALLLIVLIGAIIWVVRNRRKEKTKISFKEGLDLTELPIATFYSGGQKLHFLLDTGSNISYIDKAALDKVKHRPLNMRSNTIGVEGTGVETIHYEVTIEYKGNEFTEEFGAIDFTTTFDEVEHDSGIRLHGILGNKFFEKYRYILDFRDLIAYR